MNNDNYYINQNLSANKNQYPEAKEVVNSYSNMTFDSIIKINKGKLAKLHTSFPYLKKDDLQIYGGTIENIGNDYIVIKSPSTGSWQVLPIKYINVIEFEEPLHYL